MVALLGTIDVKGLLVQQARDYFTYGNAFTRLELETHEGHD